MNDLIKVGIIGGAGYVAGELLRLLLNHPAVEIIFVNSEPHAGDAITDVHSGLYGETDLCFTDELPFDEVDVVFFCCNQGATSQFIAEHYIPVDVRLIDLGQDFRLASDDNDYVYGLPELNALQLQGAQHVANPGSCATCIELALLPLAAHNWLDGDLSVSAIIGATDTGAHPTATTHFSWRSGNLSLFKPFHHPHLPEILQTLRKVQPSFDASLDFIPYRGDFPRGLFATAVTRCEATEEEIVEAYRTYYDDASFTHYVDREIDLKQVINTNKCLLHAEKHGEKVLITAVLDNLLKGAAGQAVQNMNLMFGLEETAGLRLKPLAF